MTEKYQYKTINPFKISKYTERSKTRLFSSMSNIRCQIYGGGRRKPVYCLAAGRTISVGYCLDNGFLVVFVARRECFNAVPDRYADYSTVLPGTTTVISDLWRAYAGIDAIGFNHLTVNRSSGG